MSKIIIKDGALGVNESELDFLIGDEVSLPPMDIQDNTRIEYNQGSSKDCTIYASLGAISDLFNYEYTKDQIQKLVDLSYENGREKGYGRYTQNAVRLICKQWNIDNPDKKVIFYSIGLKSSTFKDALKKGYSVVVTFRGNTAYVNDYMPDGVLNGKEFPNPTYGHCVNNTARLEMGDDGAIYVKDNYKGRSYRGKDRNYYKLEDLQALVDNKVFYAIGYLIIPEKNTQQTLERLKELSKEKQIINEILAKNSELRHCQKETETSVKDEIHQYSQYLRAMILQIDLEMKRI